MFQFFGSLEPYMGLLERSNDWVERSEFFVRITLTIF